jgi:hypothetical protein
MLCLCIDFGAGQKLDYLEAPDDESDLFRTDFGVLSVRVLEKGESGRSSGD